MKFLVLFILVSLVLGSAHAEEKANLTELLVAFNRGLVNAVEPVSTITLSDRLRAFKSNMQAYDDLVKAWRDEFSLDDVNRYVSYAVLADSLLLSAWTNLAVAELGLFTTSVTLTSAILGKISSSLGLTSGILATIITLEATRPLSVNSTSSTRELLAQTVLNIADRPSATALMDGRLVSWLRLLKKALSITNSAASSLRAVSKD